MTSCFVYKVMGLTFHDRINTQLIYRIAVAQVVSRRITKPQRTFFRFESHWLLFLFIFLNCFFLGGGGEGRGGGGLILLFSSRPVGSNYRLGGTITDWGGGHT